MSPRLARPALLLALAAGAALALPASAAPNATVVLTDQAGDANGLNDQGLAGAGPEGTAGPSQAQYDVVKLTVDNLGTTTTKKVGKKTVSTFTCTGYTATIELSGPPAASNTLYRVLGKGAVNTSLFWLQYQNNPVSGTTTTLRHSDGTSVTTPLSTPAKVEGNKVIFTVLLSDVKAAGEKGAGTPISALGVDVRTSSGAATAPMWDQLRPGDTGFTICG